MWRAEVESSNLKSVGYNPLEQVLEIEFRSGGVYQYFQVPFDVYEELLKAESKGKYFWSNIRNKYEYKKVLANYKKNK